MDKKIIMNGEQTKNMFGSKETYFNLSPSFYLFLIYIVVWYLQLGERWSGLRIEAAIVLLLLISTVVDPFRKKPEETAGFAPFIGLYFIVLLLQIINSWNPDRSWYCFTENILKFSVMGFFISRFTRTPFQMQLFMLTWLLVCFKVTQEGVLGGITGSLVWENQGIMRLHGVGLWSHPNSFSQFALGVLPFIYYLFPVVHRKVLKFSMLILLAFSLYVIFYTGSRTGYLGVICMMGVVFWKAQKKNKKRLLMAFILILPLIAIYSPESYKERFLSTFIGKEKEGHSKEARKKMYGEGWEIFKKHPLGLGIANYVLANEKYNNDYHAMHCLYLEVATHLGIHGFLVFFALIGKILAVLRKAKYRLSKLITTLEDLQSNDVLLQEARFVYAVTNATIVYLILRLFIDIFSMDLYGICWWFVIGLASSITYIIYHLQLQISEEKVVIRCT